MRPIYIVYGSVNGGAGWVAHELHAQLQDKGKIVRIIDDNDWAVLQEGQAVCLVIVATTGAGDYPKNIIPFVKFLEAKTPDCSALSYAVLALGDTCFGDTFCMAGKRIDRLLSQLDARPILSVTTVDATEIPDPMDMAVPWLDRVCHLIE